MFVISGKLNAIEKSMVINITLFTLKKFQEMFPDLSTKQLLKYERFIFYKCNNFFYNKEITKLQLMYSAIDELEKGILF